MIAMDDFMLFKKMMVKRNTALQLEAMENYESSIQRTTYGLPSSPAEEQAHYESALKASMSEIGSPSVKEEDDRDVNVVLAESLRDLEFRNKQDELEKLQLETALALSMALEEERLSVLKAEQKLEEEVQKEAQIAEDRLQARADAKIESNIIRHISGTSSKEQEMYGVPSNAAAPYPTLEESPPKPKSSTNSSSNSSRMDAKTSAPLPTSLAPVGGNVDANNDDDDDDHLKRQAEKFEREMAAAARRRKKEGTDSNPSSPSSIPIPEVKPLKIRNNSLLKPLPKIGDNTAAAEALKNEMREFQDRKLAAEKALEANRSQLEKNRREEESLRKQLDEKGHAEEDLRAKHMREQRERLLAAKRHEREEKVKEEEARRTKEGEDGLEAKARKQLKELMAQGKNKGSISNGSGAKDAKGDSNDDDMMNEKRRSAMRMALARRMKMDLLESEEARLTKMQEEQFADLDKKLSEVERNRKDAIRRDIAMDEERRARQAQFSRNMKASAASLNNDDF